MCVEGTDKDGTERWGKKWYLGKSQKGLPRREENLPESSRGLSAGVERYVTDLGGPEGSPSKENDGGKPIASIWGTVNNCSATEGPLARGSRGRFAFWQDLTAES